MLGRRNGSGARGKDGGQWGEFQLPVVASAGAIGGNNNARWIVVTVAFIFLQVFGFNARSAGTLAFWPCSTLDYEVRVDKVACC